MKDFFKCAWYWVLHLSSWVFFNVVLGSLPFIVSYFQGDEKNPFIVGALCFCFTLVSSGIYSYAVSAYSKLREHSQPFGWVIFNLGIAITWVIIVWTIVLTLPSILKALQPSDVVKYTIFFYVTSLLFSIVLNRKSLLVLVNEDLARIKIMGPVAISKSAANSFSESLKSEGDI